MNDTPTPAGARDLNDFVALSAVLTGIAASKLRPVLDTHGTAQTYLDLATAKGGATFATLMSIYRAHESEPAAEVANVILEGPSTVVANLARSIMLLWYLASWYDPDRLSALSQGPPAFVPSTVVSADAYTQGWVWRVGQTHPMGYSEWKFGYWHSAPPPLAAFIAD